MKENKINLVGYCGNNCSKCNVYQASITSDNKIKKKKIEEIEFLKGGKIDPDQLFCLGCRHPDSKHRKYLNIECNILKCAKEKEQITCGHCSFYPCNKTLTHFSKFSAKPKRNIVKAGIKMRKLGENAENIDKWLKKQKKI
ncbi:MAG: DUF3795 domain-containing protein [archaeon]|nr:DUF3795 domain-containing protein [archaeon]